MDRATNNRNDTLRFVVSDIGFFNLFYDSKLNDIVIDIKHVGKETYFRDILIFINCIKNVARVKGAELLRNNL